MIMKFKEGDTVEVLRNESWFPARVVSAYKNKFLVRFEHVQHDIERVPVGDVRPCPPSIGKKKRWILGDVVEVFDCDSWRAAKIVKVLHDDKFVVKVSSSIMLKEFRGSSLRLQLSWLDNQWIKKDTGNKQTNYKASCGDEHVHSRAYNLKQNEERVFDRFPPIKAGKRSNASVNESGIDAVEGSFKKRKKTFEVKEPSKQVHVPTKNMGMHKKHSHASNRHQVGDYPLKKMDAVNKHSHMLCPVAPLQAIDEWNECSIASCGSNYIFECTVQDSRASSRACADRSLNNDASSSCPIETKDMVSKHGSEDFTDSVHKLELQAYRSTVQAFYASGPLSWEQETLLTNLRLSLNISNEEHLLQLKHLLSAPVL